MWNILNVTMKYKLSICGRKETAWHYRALLKKNRQILYIKVSLLHIMAQQYYTPLTLSIRYLDGVAAPPIEENRADMVPLGLPLLYFLSANSFFALFSTVGTQRLHPSYRFFRVSQRIP